MTASGPSSHRSTKTDTKLLAALIESLEADEFYEDLYRFLASCLKFDNCVILVFSRSRSPLILRQWSSQEPNYFRMLYSQGAYLLDPFYLASIIQRDSGVHLLSQLAPDHFLKSDYYQTYYKKVSMVDEVGLLTPLNQDMTIHLSLGRRRGSRRVGHEEFSTLAGIEPLLAALLRRQVRGKVDAWESQPKRRNRQRSGSGPVAASSHDWLDGFDVTTRESEIASLILQGHSNTSIGQVLQISGETVKVHRKHLYSKLSISSPAELFHLFIEQIKRR